ncbi:exosome complex RNA-binding protein Rrp4 [Infirmifilum sp. NZ]|uniref:exosome complex RNA-binding protein Rrp4 n=1 Tax=Infirmifilum sp. NZ TaxID=2926850 RepID=UPI0027A47B71|nr:exosome complex RNA-binding protein Rrp4 [Infirmifilum sp. NZ]UNQ72516.1 exosome complex RNA-binding protein Rrp4 [Infirmifilum sp. NZ]
MTLYVKDRQIVIPGDPIGEQGKFSIEGHVYRVNKKFFSKVLGVVYIDPDRKIVRVIPLKGKYIPVEGHRVVGKVVEVGLTNWIVDINSPYEAILPVSEVTSKPVNISRNELAKILDEGDLILAKVVSFDYTKDPVISIKESKLGKIPKGSLVEISPQKVARIIGRKGSMVSLIEEMLGVRLIVGQNGRIVVVGDDPLKEEIAVLAIKKIEAEAHITGLTDRIREFIESRLRE